MYINTSDNNRVLRLPIECFGLFHSHPWSRRPDTPTMASPCRPAALGPGVSLSEPSSWNHRYRQRHWKCVAGGVPSEGLGEISRDCWNHSLAHEMTYLEGRTRNLNESNYIYIQITKAKLQLKQFMTWQCKWLEINVGSGHPMETKEAATFFWVRGWMAQPAKEADRSEENQTNHSEVGEFIANIFPSSLQMVGPMPHQNSRLPLYIYTHITNIYVYPFFSYQFYILQWFLFFKAKTQLELQKLPRFVRAVVWPRASAPYSSPEITGPSKSECNERDHRLPGYPIMWCDVMLCDVAWHMIVMVIVIVIRTIIYI